MKVKRIIHQEVITTFRIPNENVRPWPEDVDYVHISRRLIDTETDLQKRAIKRSIPIAAKKWPTLTPSEAYFVDVCEYLPGPKRTRFDLLVDVVFAPKAGEA